VEWRLPIRSSRSSRKDPGSHTNDLEAKVRELIALAGSISLPCDGCIAVHTAEAHKHVSSREEVAEALGVAISVNAGAAFVYSTWTMDAFDAVIEADSQCPGR